MPAGRQRGPGKSGNGVGGPPPSTRTSTGSRFTREALRARHGVSNQAASELLHQPRAGEGQPPGTSRAA